MAAVETERRRLVLVAYRICGSWADAEDVVQQASIEWLALPRPVDNPAGWLTRTTVRRAIDVLRARRRSAAAYVGPWLPEPMVMPSGTAPDEVIERRETLAMAFMVLAETLTPPQRAVVVLRSLDYTHAEIAEILGISPSAARQHQARGARRLAAAGYRDAEPRAAARWSDREDDDTAVTGRLLEAFLAAARDGDVERLSSLLHADVRAYQDGGGKVRAARRVLTGVRNVARFTAGVAALNRSRRSVTFVDVNGAPGAIVTLAGVPHVLSIEVRDGRVYRVFDVCNPDKHTTFGRHRLKAAAEAA